MFLNNLTVAGTYCGRYLIDSFKRNYILISQLSFIVKHEETMNIKNSLIKVFKMSTMLITKSHVLYWQENVTYITNFLMSQLISSTQLICEH